VLGAIVRHDDEAPLFDEAPQQILQQKHRGPYSLNRHRRLLRRAASDQTGAELPEKSINSPRLMRPQVEKHTLPHCKG
jgi:hypothetical protein